MNRLITANSGRSPKPVAAQFRGRERGLSSPTPNLDGIPFGPRGAALYLDKADPLAARGPAKIALLPSRATSGLPGTTGSSAATASRQRSLHRCARAARLLPLRGPERPVQGDRLAVMVEILCRLFLTGPSAFGVRADRRHNEPASCGVSGSPYAFPPRWRIQERSPARFPSAILTETPAGPRSSGVPPITRRIELAASHDLPAANGIRVENGDLVQACVNWPRVTALNEPLGRVPKR